MAATRRDGAQRLEGVEEDVRRLWLRKKGHTETKTFIVGGDITPDLYIPPLFVGIDADDDTPEWKILWGFRGVLREGNAAISWQRNGVEVITHDITTVPNENPAILDPAIDLADGDTLRPVIASSFLAVDLAAAVVMITAAS